MSVSNGGVLTTNGFVSTRERMEWEQVGQGYLEQVIHRPEGGAVKGWN